VANGSGDAAAHRAIASQSISIGLAVVPFGLAFGAACSSAGLPWTVALAFSALVFTGGTQFAAVSVLAGKGSALTAIAAGLLLAVRSLAYGVVMAPHLAGGRLRRAIMSQLMIDESVAVASTQTERHLRERGYLWCGASVFVTWNAATLVGAIALRNADDLIRRWGLDATIPAAFLALLWPRLNGKTERVTALVGALISFVAIPAVPAGLPIIAAGLAVFLVRSSATQVAS
jgi:4-azaleucine resistance transporter AzlC